MFVSRIETRIFEEIICETTRLSENKNLETAIDSTGFQFEDVSYSCMNRIGTAKKKRKNLKLSECVDTKEHLFLTVKIRKSNAHDNRDFKPLILKTKKTEKIIVFNTADKAYDSEELHEFSKQNGFENIVPVREFKDKGYKTKGKEKR